VKSSAAALGEALERLLPLLTFTAVVAAGWFAFVQPRFAAYLRTGTDAAALEERVQTLQQAAARAQPGAPADLERSQREFEDRVSAEDRVADIAEALARAVLAGAPAGQLRGFVIETGGRVTLAPRGRSADAGDPRLALFPYVVSYAPLRVSFESTFEAAGRVLWQLRDLPTAIEVHSATLTRGLPLMRIDLLVRVLQRGGPADVAAPADAGAAAPGPTAPRLAPAPPAAEVSR
jgi:hypothetical protein